METLEHTCPICQSYLLSRKGTFTCCSNCGLLIRVNSTELSASYIQGWKKPLENLNLTGGTTPALAKNYTTELIRTLGLSSLSGKRILDFGGGRGEMALALKAAGADVVVVDPFSFDQLNRKKINAVKSLDDLEKSSFFDGAIAIDVIEHLQSPWVEFSQIRNLLKPGVWLYLSTPNAAGINSKINKENWREAQNPSHLLLFTPQSLEKVLKKSGFTSAERQKWNIQYSDKWFIQWKDWLLSATKLDGVLRYIAFI